MQSPAALVRATREPLRVRRRIPVSGMGAALNERLMVGTLVNQISQVFIDVRKTLTELEPALASMSSSYADFKKDLTKIGMQAMKLSPGAPMSLGWLMAAPINAAVAVMRSVKAAQDQGVDYRESHEALIAIADSINQTEAATYAFRKITLADLVSIGVLTESQAVDVASRAGFDRKFWKFPGLEAIADGWAKKAGSTVPYGWIDVRWREYVQVRTRIEKTITGIATMMGISSKISFATDEALAESIKSKLLAEMKKAHDEVKANRRPEGWLSSAFNRAVEIAAAAPWLLLFGVAGIVFGHFMAPILKLDVGLSRTAFAASRLVQASVKIAAAGITTYAAVYKEERVNKSMTDSQAKAAATSALEKTVATVGKDEYNQAYKEIEDYRNYAKSLKLSLEGFLEGLLGWIKWIAIGAGVLLVGGFVISRAMQPTQRIELVVRR